MISNPDKDPWKSQLPPTWTEPQIHNPVIPQVAYTCWDKDLQSIEILQSEAQTTTTQTSSLQNRPANNLDTSYIRHITPKSSETYNPRPAQTSETPIMSNTSHIRHKTPKEP